MPVLLICTLAASGCTTLVGDNGDILKCEIDKNGGDPCPVEEGLECSSAGVCQPIQKPPPPIECEPVIKGRDPCPPGKGLRCVSGICEQCHKAPMEICNGIDDDCNGLVDEGFDKDSDGFTWCGGGVFKLRDCGPDDPAMHPADPSRGVAAAEEVCDGMDNDCNEEIDELPECEIIPDCDPTDPTTCDPEYKCDLESKRCVLPLDPGSACNNDSGCKGDAICIDPTALDLAGWTADGMICARACCSDADCKGDNVCLIRGTGVRVCLPANYAGLDTKRAGESCEINAECSSGICDQDQRICRTACTTSEDCEDEFCVYDPTLSYLSYQANPGQFVCGPQGYGEPTRVCYLTSGCASGLCIPSIWGITGTCTIPCGSKADCEPFNAQCGYHEARFLFVINPRPETRVSYCYFPDVEPTDIVCCKDEHCGEGSRCRPVFRNGAWGMYCTPEIG